MAEVTNRGFSPIDSTTLKDIRTILLQSLPSIQQWLDEKVSHGADRILNLLEEHRASESRRHGQPTVHLDPFFFNDVIAGIERFGRPFLYSGRPVIYSTPEMCQLRIRLRTSTKL